VQQNAASLQQNQGPAAQPPAAAPQVQAAVPPPPPASTALADESKTAPQKAADPGLLKKQAQDYASNGRCDEAVALFQQLERQHPKYNITPTERLSYVRCLRQTGRIQAAEFELNEVKANKQLLNTAVDAEQVQIDREKKASAYRARQQVSEQQASPARAAKKAKAKPAASAPADAAETKSGL
jgi:hypothetical protein